MLKMTKKKAQIGCQKQFYAMCSHEKWGKGGGGGEGGEKEGKKEENKKKQSQKHYMVSGSLCPIISFLDI